MVSPRIWGANRFGPGDWTAVSGLRQADGTIVASRLDSAPPNMLIVRGSVSLDGGTPHIGALALDGPATRLHAGDVVVASGSYSHGTAHIVTIARDELSSDPTRYFGDSVSHVVVQAFVRVSHGTIWLNDHLHVPAAAGVQAESAASGDAIVSLERGSDGSFTATGLRYTGYRGMGGEISEKPASSVMAALSPPLISRFGSIPPAPMAAAPVGTAPGGDGCSAIDGHGTAARGITRCWCRRGHYRRREWCRFRWRGGTESGNQLPWWRVAPGGGADPDDQWQWVRGGDFDSAGADGRVGPPRHSGRRGPTGNRRIFWKRSVRRRRR